MEFDQRPAHAQLFSILTCHLHPRSERPRYACPAGWF